MMGSKSALTVPVIMQSCESAHQIDEHDENQYGQSRSERRDNRLRGDRITLNPVLEGEVEELIQSCITQDQQERLEELASEASTATSI